jgi:phospholipid transport system substrate-binding protein
MPQFAALIYKDVSLKLKIKNMKKLLFVAAIFFTNSLGFAAEQKSSEVKTFVEEVGNNIIKIAGESKLSESNKKDKIIAVIDTAIDSNWIARFVLGKNYKTATDPQKERFTKLYRDFMINTYGPKFKNYNGRSFTVNEVVEQGGFFIAKAEFLPKNSNVPISVDFRVKERDGKLAILDFIAEGVSLIETQRSEFNSAISQNGIEKFLNDLDTRVKKLKAIS